MPRLIIPGILLVAALATFNACSDDDEDSASNSPTQQPTEQVTPSPQDETFTPSPSAAATKTVVIQDFAFNPPQFAVPADEVVAIEVANDDRSSHTFTVYNDAEFANPQGISLALTSDTTKTGFGTFAAGTYYFRCEVHPDNMQGAFNAE